MPLLRSLTVPISGLAQILRRAPTAKIRLAHRELRYDVAILRKNSHYRELGFEEFWHLFRLGEFIMVEGSIITLHCYALHISDLSPSGLDWAGTRSETFSSHTCVARSVRTRGLSSARVMSPAAPLFSPPLLSALRWRALLFSRLFFHKLDDPRHDPFRQPRTIHWVGIIEVKNELRVRYSFVGRHCEPFAR